MVRKGNNEASYNKTNHKLCVNINIYYLKLAITLVLVETDLHKHLPSHCSYVNNDSAI